LFTLGYINPVDAQSPSHYENVMMPMETSRLKVIELAAFYLGIKNNSVNLAAEYEVCHYHFAFSKI